MKIAITANGKRMESKLDSTFGRCAYFIIYNTQNEELEYIENLNRSMEEDAGSASVQLLESKSVDKIISYEFGMKIKPMLDKLKIQMIIIKDDLIQIKNIIKMLDSNKKRKDE